MLDAAAAYMLGENGYELQASDTDNVISHIDELVKRIYLKSSQNHRQESKSIL